MFLFTSSPPSPPPATIDTKSEIREVFSLFSFRGLACSCYCFVSGKPNPDRLDMTAHCLSRPRCQPTPCFHLPHSRICLLVYYLYSICCLHHQKMHCLSLRIRCLLVVCRLGGWVGGLWCPTRYFSSRSETRSRFTPGTSRSPSSAGWKTWTGQPGDFE